MCSTDDPNNKSHRAEWPERVTAIVGIIAVLVAADQINDSVKARRAQNYLELRKAFFEIDKSLDGLDRNATYPKNEQCSAWNALKRYWYYSQTEWALQNIDSDQKTNWENYAKFAIVKSLDQPMFRKSFLEMGATRFHGNEAGERFYCSVAHAYLTDSKSNILSFGDSKFPKQDAECSNEKTAPVPLVDKCSDGLVPCNDKNLPKCDTDTL